MRYNVFGGTVSGPIRRNKLFYFLGYEGSKRRDGRTAVMTVPSVLERGGDFTQTFNSNGSLGSGLRSRNRDSRHSSGLSRKSHPCRPLRQSRA